MPKVVLPERFQESKIIFAGSEEHQNILKETEQAKTEVEWLKRTKAEVDAQLHKNQEIQSELLKENYELKEVVQQKTATIWKLRCILIILGIGLLGLLKIKAFG
jgi:hypothetical protein